MVPVSMTLSGPDTDFKRTLLKQTDASAHCPNYMKAVKRNLL